MDFPAWHTMIHDLCLQHLRPDTRSVLATKKLSSESGRKRCSQTHLLERFTAMPSSRAELWERLSCDRELVHCENAREHWDLSVVNHSNCATLCSLENIGVEHNRTPNLCDLGMQSSNRPTVAAQMQGADHSVSWLKVNKQQSKGCLLDIKIAATLIHNPKGKTWLSTYHL